MEPAYVNSSEWHEDQQALRAKLMTAGPPGLEPPPPTASGSTTASQTDSVARQRRIANSGQLEGKTARSSGSSGSSEADDTCNDTSPHLSPADPLGRDAAQYEAHMQELYHLGMLPGMNGAWPPPFPGYHPMHHPYGGFPPSPWFGAPPPYLDPALHPGFPPHGFGGPPALQRSYSAPLGGGYEAWAHPPGMGEGAGPPPGMPMTHAPFADGKAAALAAGIPVDAAEKSVPSKPPDHAPAMQDDEDNDDDPGSIGPPPGLVRSLTVPEGFLTSPVNRKANFMDGTSEEKAPLDMTGTRASYDDSHMTIPPPPLLGRVKSCPASTTLPVITRSTCEDSGALRINWTVDARKLKVKDKVAVSPPFELCDGVPGTFRIMLRPKAVSERKGGASFKKAKGKGMVEMKCESPDGQVHNGGVSLTISVGSGNEDRHALDAEPPRGPTMHNFAENSVFSLPAEQDEWDFGKATDEDTQNFVVCLEVLKP